LLLLAPPHTQAGTAGRAAPCRVVSRSARCPLPVWTWTRARWCFCQHSGRSVLAVVVQVRLGWLCHFSFRFVSIPSMHMQPPAMPLMDVLGCRPIPDDLDLTSAARERSDWIWFRFLCVGWVAQRPGPASPSAISLLGAVLCWAVAVSGSHACRVTSRRRFSRGGSRDCDWGLHLLVRGAGCKGPRRRRLTESLSVSLFVNWSVGKGSGLVGW